MADFAISSSGDVNDSLALLAVGTFLPSGNIDEPTKVIKLEQEPTDAYSFMVRIAKAYDLGFRLVRQYDNSTLHFDVYTGNDRTSQQQTLPPMVFRPDMGTINDITELESISEYANVARVYGEFGSVVVYDKYDDNDDPIEQINLRRRVLVVNASPDPNSPTYTQDLIDAGERALAASREIEMFDGKIDIYSGIVYDSDYSLGDRIEIRNQDGSVKLKRVTEQVFIEDEQGERFYPTFSTGS